MKTVKWLSLLMPLLGTAVGLFMLSLVLLSKVPTAPPVVAYRGEGGTGFILLYRFAGVSDDGAQGSLSRREATAVHCTNSVDQAVQVEVQVYQWNGMDVFTGTAEILPGRTATFSTQNTTIFFDDVILGGSPGTEALFQGSGQIWGSRPGIICTVQVIDPLNYPPTFATKLTLYTGDGYPVGTTRTIYLPVIVKP